MQPRNRFNNMSSHFQRYRDTVQDAFVPLFEEKLQHDLPIFQLLRKQDAAGWSAAMADFLDEVSQHHFMDVYNRRLMTQGLKAQLSRENCEYLDVGCSSGYMLQEVKSSYPGAHITGCDYELLALDYCHQRNPGVPLFRVDLTDCPFKDDCFDVVTCLNVLEHIKNDDQALKELYRIVKPGGMMGLTVPLGPELYDFYDEVHCHYLRYRYSELLHKIRAAGFTIHNSNRFGVAIYPAFYLMKRFNQWRHGHKTLEQKYALATKQAKATGGTSAWMNAVCNLESYIGTIIPYPVGVRGYVLATKPPKASNDAT